MSSSVSSILQASSLVLSLASVSCSHCHLPSVNLSLVLVQFLSRVRRCHTWQDEETEAEAGEHGEGMFDEAAERQADAASTSGESQQPD